MAFRGDDRAQSVQVGAVILFGFLVVAMAGYQANVVPADNREAEFNHEQGVQEDMSDLRNALLGAGIGGDGAPQTVRLGMRYPDRTFFVNPPPVPGALETGPERTIWLNGTALADPDADDAWSENDENVSFDTRALVHEAQYYVSNEDPRNRIEHGLLYSAYENANVTRTDQPLISGNRLTLVTVNGSLDRAGLDATTVDPQRLSVSTRETTLKTGPDPEIFLPTANASVWERAIEEDPDTDDSYVESVTAAPGGVVVELRPDATFRLRLAQVGVGSGGADPGPAYITPEEGQNETVRENGTQTITASVRDRFTNPVAGVSVNATLVSSMDGSINASGDAENRTDLVTDADGEVTFTYSAPADITGSASKQAEIRLGVKHDPAALQSGGYDKRGVFNTTIRVNVENSDGSGVSGGGGNPGSNINPNEDGAVILNDATLSNNNASVTFENRGNTTRSFDQARFNFYYRDSQGNSKVTQPKSVRFHNDTGGYVVLQSASSGGTFQDVAFSLSGTSQKTLDLSFYSDTDATTGNEIDISPGDFFVMSVIFDNGQTATYFVAPVSGGANQAPTASFTTSTTSPSVGEDVSFDASGSSDSDGSIASYEWDFGDGTTGTGETTTHSYSSSGSKTVKLTVTDNDGGTDTATEQIGVGTGGTVDIHQAQIDNGQIDIQFTNNRDSSVTFSRAQLNSYSEDTVQNGEQIDRVVYRPSSDDVNLISGENLENINGPTISSGGNQEVTLQPQRDTNTQPGNGNTNIQNADAQSGDSITFTIEFSDGTTRQFTVTL